MVLLISLNVAPPSVELCHFATVPVCPLNVRVPVFVPEHTVAAELTAPPTDTGFTVMATVGVVTDEHTPLCITALYKVLVVIFEYDCEVAVLTMSV